MAARPSLPSSTPGPRKPVRNTQAPTRPTSPEGPCQHAPHVPCGHATVREVLRWRPKSPAAEQSLAPQGPGLGTLLRREEGPVVGSRRTLSSQAGIGWVLQTQGPCERQACECHCPRKVLACPGHATCEARRVKKPENERLPRRHPFLVSRGRSSLSSWKECPGGPRRLTSSRCPSLGPWPACGADACP